MPTEVIEQMVEFGREAAAEGLLLSTSGNASLRVDAERIAITSSGSELRKLHHGDVSIVRIRDGELLAGPKPSIETAFHRAIYQRRPGVGAVLRCQSRAATLLACRPGPAPNLNLTTEVATYVRRYVVLPYRVPGSPKLVEDIMEAFEDANVRVVQMKNRGQVIVGRTWRDTISRGVFFEMACWMAVQGLELEPIPDADVAVLWRIFPGGT